jgi:excisionase family DNA binding protein
LIVGLLSWRGRRRDPPGRLCGAVRGVCGVSVALWRVSVTPVRPLGACVRGFSAFFIARLCEKHAPAYWASLAVQGASPAELAGVREAIADLVAASDAWERWRASVTEELVAEVGSDLDSITSREAATALGVSVRRVLQLLAAGDLSGRLVGRVWLVSRVSVEERRNMNLKSSEAS